MSFKAQSKIYDNFRDSTLNYFGDLPVTAFDIKKCFYCRDDEYHTVFTLDSLWIVRCKCGFVYSRRQPKEETLSQFYNNSKAMTEWASLKQSPAEAQRQKEKFTQAIDFFIKEKVKTLCDLGCGAGGFLKLYREKDPFVELTGVDPNAKSLEYLKDDNVFTSNETIENYLIGNRGIKFDAISLFGVLEHLADPIYALNSVKNALKPGGFLLVCVPNVNSRAVRMLWEDCFTFCPQHLWYFDVMTLSRLFNHLGFMIKSHYTIEPEELPVMKKSWGFKPYELVPTWAEKKYFSNEKRKFLSNQILASNEGYKIIAIAQKL